MSGIREKLKGVGVALVTPFNVEKNPDFFGFQRVINYVIENGVDYVVVLGTTGETPTLSDEERQELIRKCVEYTAGRVPVVAGFGGNDTMYTIEELQRFDLKGVDAILSVSPMYNKPTQSGIFEHYKAIALSTNLPILLYNVPGRTSSNIEAETTIKLAKEFKNIIGIKEASADMGQCTKLARDKPKDFLLISGCDDLILPQIAIGFDGVISVVGNATPKHFAELVHTGLQGDLTTARSIHFELYNLFGMLFEQGNPAGVKCALAHQEVCQEFVRLPLVQVDEPLRQRIGIELKKLGLN
jgi:4-hydroxy-tetrahydrodipicolinate synthase